MARRDFIQRGLLLFSLLVCRRCLAAYDSSSMQFHPDGRILQIEYSKDAVKKGGLISAYKCRDGIVITAVRKAPMSKFLVNQMQKIFTIDSNIVIAATGLLFDANLIVSIAKRICLQHKSIYCDEMPIENLCEELSEIMHKQVCKIILIIFLCATKIDTSDITHSTLSPLSVFEDYW